MQPSDYIPNEPPERKALHEFICATVAACVASIYPRADPQRFRRIIDGTQVAACVEEACSACREAAAERLRLGYSGPCPCRHCVACREADRLAAIHCSSTDGRKVVGDAVNARLLAIDQACLDETNARLAAASSEVTIVYSDHDTKESIGAAVRQAIQTNSSGGGQSSHPDS